MDPKQPLWLPRGSVRAIIALAFVAATIYGTLTSLSAQDVPAALAALFPVTAVVVNAYFEKRGASS